MFYPITESCRRRGINAELYLRDLLEKLPEMPQLELKNYVPAAWLKTHPEARVIKPK